MPELSIIVPVYNEQNSIKELYASLVSVLNSIAKSFEIIFVDDGSDDNSSRIMNELSNKGLIAMSLSKRSGASLAFASGFARSKGQIIVTLDADLQHEPKDIPLLLSKLDEGFDVVCGWRHNRRDSMKQIIASRLANYLRRLIFQERIHDVGCSLRVYKREAFNALNLRRQRHRFITAILAKKGFKLAEIKVRHYPRRYGRSKYNVIGRFIRSIPDFIFLLAEPTNR